ncbi:MULTISPECIES: flagellar biosynthesis regulator FlaF [unclassified Hyphomicrobium]|uniref:flagellar biosynthesis regulator FlaF n=1 Tax=unclassified Hyphomicrobium TaxID=2619925 RepID=UPI000213D8D6|nr:MULTISPECIES: flagellar biosynthesis regulator FlaF [unclassified Hyphomicrobium]CCB67529.1 Flagellar FlaF family protein [Hyphomicrobium sp. MC1]
MYKFSYEETLSESGNRQRENERLALEQSVALLKTAEKAGPQSREAIDAIIFLNRLWSFFLEDLAKPENGLPDDVRAKLISIGIWMLKEAEAISNGKSRNFAGLIDVSNVIAEGL